MVAYARVKRGKGGNVVEGAVTMVQILSAITEAGISSKTSNIKTQIK